MMRKHYIVGSANTQKVISLSSAEAEYYALTKTASRTLGFMAMAEDLGITNLKGRIYTDSSGAKGIAMRKGAGKIRHIETQTLWLQDVLIRKDLSIRKVDGKKNPADIGTKILPSAAAWDAILTQLDVGDREGRSGVAKSAAV